MRKEDLDKIIRCVDGGVCRSIEELCKECLDKECLDKEFDSLSTKDQREIEDAIFTCTDCGWTMPNDELSEEEDGVCRECAGE